MRLLFTAGIITCFGGCASYDPAPPHLASQPCAKVAEFRTDGARVNGYDEKDQQTVFRYAYADCVKWEAKGYEPPAP